MAKPLNLRLEEHLIEKVKRYATLHNTSVSQFFAQVIEELEMPQTTEGRIQVPPLYPDHFPAPTDKELQEAETDYYLEKHGE